MMDRGRLFLIAAFFFLPLGGLEARLIQLQLLTPESYAGRFGSRCSVNLAVPAHGKILDRSGRVLAGDERTFDLYLVLEEFEKSPSTRSALEALLGAGLHDDLELAYRKIENQMNLRPERERPQVYRRERRSPYLIRRGIPFEKAYVVELGHERYPGCVVREGLRRVYPYGRTGGALVGYLGRISDREAAPGKPSEYDLLLKEGAFTEGFEELIGEDGIAQLARRGLFLEELVGRAGVERSFHDRLRGKAGLFILERDADSGGREWIELKPSEPGQDIELTIDIELQRDIEAILADAKDGCPHPVRAHAVVMEVGTGEIFALASNAGYDPNDFIPPSKAAALEAYFKDPAQPLLMHPVCNRFQAGSVFKIVTAAAALEEKRITPSTRFHCGGAYSERYSKFNCWTVGMGQQPHGDIDVAGALQHSCNCFFFAAAERLEPAALETWAGRFGFGRTSGIDLPGETAGTLPGPSAGGRWLVTDSFNLAVGQGDLMATPVQVARSMCAIANGGALPRPHVLRGADPGAESVAMSPATLAAIRKGLRDCSHEPGGTAYETDLKRFGVAGKTGSAQRADRHHPHAWFAGYMPVDRPKFAIVVLAEAASGGGGHVAAPLAAKIAQRLAK